MTKINILAVRAYLRGAYKQFIDLGGGLFEGVPGGQFEDLRYLLVKTNGKSQQ